MLLEIEQALIERLKPLEGLRLVVRGKNNRLGNARKIELPGEVIIEWDQNSGGNDFLTDRVGQILTTTWVIRLRMPNLRDRNGAYALIEYCRLRLLGFRPPFCKAIYLQSERILETEDDEAHRLREFECRYLVEAYITEFEDPEAQETALLKAIEFALGEQYTGFTINKDTQISPLEQTIPGTSIPPIRPLSVPSPSTIT